MERLLPWFITGSSRNGWTTAKAWTIMAFGNALTLAVYAAAVTAAVALTLRVV